MSSRDTILAAVRANQPAPAPVIPDIPLFERPAGLLVAEFREALLRMGGKFAETQEGKDLDRFIRSLFPQAQVICSAVPEVKGNRALSGIVEPADLADVDVGVVRAAFAVAETGSIWLSETELQVNSLAFLAQHLARIARPRRYRRQPTSRLWKCTVQDGTVCRAGHRSFGHGRYRRRVDPWGTGGPQSHCGAPSAQLNSGRTWLLSYKLSRRDSQIKITCAEATT